GPMLCVGDICDDLAAILDAITSRIVWMIERPGAETNARVRHQNLARGKINKLDLCGEDPHRDGEQRRDHHVIDYRFDALPVQMTGPDPDLAVTIVAWGKERQSANMVEMRMTVEQVEVGGLTAACELITQQAQPRSTVEDHQVVPTADLHARSVPPVTNGIGP